MFVGRLWPMQESWHEALLHRPGVRGRWVGMHVGVLNFEAAAVRPRHLTLAGGCGLLSATRCLFFSRRNAAGAVRRAVVGGVICNSREPGQKFRAVLEPAFYRAVLETASAPHGASFARGCSIDFNFYPFLSDSPPLFPKGAALPLLSSAEEKIQMRDWCSTQKESKVSNFT